jgi:hypothetical protein
MQPELRWTPNSVRQEFWILFERAVATDNSDRDRDVRPWKNACIRLKMFGELPDAIYHSKG